MAVPLRQSVKSRLTNVTLVRPGIGVGVHVSIKVVSSAKTLGAVLAPIWFLFIGRVLVEDVIFEVLGISVDSAKELNEMKIERQAL